MTKVPFIPEAAPFSEDQRAWLSGFLAGLHSRVAMQQQAVPATAATAAAAAPARLAIFYGTQTGNAEALAQDTAAAAGANGFAPQVIALDDVSADDLAATSQAVFIVSTYGEGEMPDNAQLFWETLSAGTMPRLEKLRYGVLALGDTSYDEFCQAGKLIDMRLEQLGATRLRERIDCDVDYEDAAAGWIAEALKALADVAEPSPDSATAAIATTVAAATAARPKWNRKNPYHAATVENRLLSRGGSAKEIRHFAFDLGDSQLAYEAGDALGVVPRNAPDLVAAMLTCLGAGADDPVAGLDGPLGEALAGQFEIVTPSRELIAALAERSASAELRNAVAGGVKEELEAFLWGRDTLDLLTLDPQPPMDVAEFVSFLKPLQHRAYSISSCPGAHPGEVHLTVAAVRWERDGRPHRGVCSTHLADALQVGDTVPIFVSPNKSFRLPADDDAPVIMVGPGTGIAPFRAFLEERRVRGAGGRNWLFFGDQHRDRDFIYEDEISAMSASGLLTRLDLAFSRDQHEKIYVQSRMHENGKALYAWLEDGGYFYVCGDATRMAKDVDAALIEIVALHGALSPDNAAAYVAELKRAKRYVRDVY